MPNSPRNYYRFKIQDDQSRMEFKVPGSMIKCKVPGCVNLSESNIRKYYYYTLPAGICYTCFKAQLDPQEDHIDRCIRGCGGYYAHLISSGSSCDAVPLKVCYLCREKESKV